MVDHSKKTACPLGGPGVKVGTMVAILSIIVLAFGTAMGAGFGMHNLQPHAGAVRESEYARDHVDLTNSLREIKDALIRIEGRLDLIKSP